MEVKTLKLKRVPANESEIPEKLKVKSRSYPEVKDKLLEAVLIDIRQKIEKHKF